MARINVEDGLFKEKRWEKLLLKTGSMDMALGALVRAWSLAQKYWLTPSQLIPEDAWRREEIHPAILECGWAEKREQGIYVCGSKEQFAWLTACSEKGKKGGPAAAKARVENKRKSKRQKSSVDRQESSQHDTPQPLSLPLSLSPSLSSGSSSVSKEERPKGEVAVATIAADNPVPVLIGTYVKAYQAKYGQNTRPDVGGKVRGMMQRYLADVPLGRACELLQVYLQIDDPWFKTKHHDFGTFIENQNKIALALDTGKNPHRQRSVAEIIGDEEAEGA